MLKEPRISLIKRICQNRICRGDYAIKRLTKRLEYVRMCQQLEDSTDFYEGELLITQQNFVEPLESEPIDTHSLAVL